MHGATVVQRAEAGRRLGGGTGLVLLVVVGAYPLVVGDPALIRAFVYIGILSIVAVGLNFSLGYAGEFALGQAGIFAAGAYLAGILTTRGGWSFWAALPVAALAAAVVGVVVCLPGLRIGGWYFALTSLFIAVVLPDVARVAPYTGGTQGFGGIPVPSVNGRELAVGDLYLFVAVSLVVVLLVLANVVHSPWGLALKSMRESNKAAEASGIAVFRMKLVAYVCAGLLAGYAGAILPVVDGYLAPDAFPLSLSILLVAGVTIGGTGRLVGPVVGVGLLQVLPHVVAGFDRYSLLIYGSILILGMLFIRRGILPTAGDAWVSLWLRATRQRAARPPEPEPTAGDRADPAPAPVALHTLTVSKVDKHFNGVHALREVSVIARPGEITAVIGPNGSGKTTLLNVIMGFYRLDAGQVSLNGRQVSGRRPFQIARAGLARTFQTPVVLPEHSCRENVMSGGFTRRRATLAEVVLRLGRARRDWRTAADRADALLRFVGLGAQLHVAGDSLTAGHQRLLEIARALASGPGALLLDEPAAGLVGAEVEALAGVLRQLRDAGFAVVLVEHNINLVMAVADQVTVLDRGRVIASADPATVQRDPAVLDSYLGERAHA